MLLAAFLAGVSAVLGGLPHAAIKAVNIALSTCVIGVLLLKKRFLMSLWPNAIVCPY